MDSPFCFQLDTYGNGAYGFIYGVFGRTIIIVSINGVVYLGQIHMDHGGNECIIKESKYKFTLFIHDTHH